MHTPYKLLFLILIYLIPSELISQDNEIPNNAYFYPNVKSDRKIIQTLGLATAEIPESIVEFEDIYRSPLFFYKIKYLLLGDFILEGAAESNIITNQVSVGPGFGLNYKNFGLSMGTNIAWWFGRLKLEGFNTTIYGWHIYPNISTGYKFPHFTVTLNTEIQLTLSQTSKTGSIKEKISGDTFSAFSFGLYMEQPLWKDHYIVLGLKSNFTKFYLPLWAAFPTFDRFIYLSEIIIGYNL